MTSLWIRATLLTDAAITESSATTGGHRSLGYLPGAALLGAVARRKYGGMDAETAFRVFHSGAVRFGPALPQGFDGAPTIPMPLALHHGKREKWKEPDKEPKKLSPNVENHSRVALREGTQYSQCREGFLDGALFVHETARRASLRTAMTEGGRARDQALYQVSALPAGLALLARIDADQAADLVAVREVLDRGVVTIGRSRGAEFGSARTEVIPEPPAGAMACAQPHAGMALFLCVSDLALRDSKTGQPSLEPRKEDFGLEGPWKWDAARSFLRFRRYSPFNAWRRRPDLERQVIAAGSVIVFTASDGRKPGAGEVGQAVARGIGEYRCDGLGQVLFEPALLADARVRATSLPLPVTDAPPCRGPEGDELLIWVERQNRARRASETAWTQAMALVRQFGGKLPPSQWGELRVLARRFRGTDGKGLLAELTAHVVEPADSQDKLKRAVRHGERRWGKRIMVQSEGDAGKGMAETTLGKHLVSCIGQLQHPAETLELLASFVVREKRKEVRR